MIHKDLGPSTYVSVAILSVIMTFILKYLTTRIMWLPDPLGALIGWEWIASLSGVWIVALVDVIIKYSVLRLDGSKLYDEKVIPFIGGIILGTVLDVLGANAIYYVMYRPTM